MKRDHLAEKIVSYYLIAPYCSVKHPSNYSKLRLFLIISSMLAKELISPSLFSLLLIPAIVLCFIYAYLFNRLRIQYKIIWILSLTDFIHLKIIILKF